MLPIYGRQRRRENSLLGSYPEPPQRSHARQCSDSYRCRCISCRSARSIPASAATEPRGRQPSCLQPIRIRRPCAPCPRALPMRATIPGFHRMITAAIAHLAGRFSSRNQGSLQPEHTRGIPCGIRDGQTLNRPLRCLHSAFHRSCANFAHGAQRSNRNSGNLFAETPLFCGSGALERAIDRVKRNVELVCQPLANYLSFQLRESPSRTVRVRSPLVERFADHQVLVVS